MIEIRGQNEEGEWKQRKIEVTEEYYNKVAVGDFVDFKKKE
jgi:hypothetical protein